jgi:hypothetical protein
MTGALADWLKVAVVQNTYVFNKFIIQSLIEGVQTRSSPSLNDLHRRSHNSAEIAV